MNSFVTALTFLICRWCQFGWYQSANLNNYPSILFLIMPFNDGKASVTTSITERRVFQDQPGMCTGITALWIEKILSCQLSSPLFLCSPYPHTLPGGWTRGQSSDVHHLWWPALHTDQSRPLSKTNFISSSPNKIILFNINISFLLFYLTKLFLLFLLTLL